VQVGTVVFSVLAGGVAAAVLVPDAVDRVEAVTVLGPQLWVLAFTAVLILGWFLTIRIWRRLLAEVTSVIRSRRQAELGRPASHLPESASQLPPELADSLTGLGNHRAFHEALDQQLGQLSRAGASAALSVALLDLDEFKTVNDLSGHAHGDKVLVEFTRRLRKVVRRSDHAFRTGGDEFAILLTGTRAEDAAVVVQRLLAACIEPRPGSAAPGGFSFSAGISDAPARSSVRSELIAQADRALFEGKQTGRTSVRVFDPAQEREMDGPALRRAASAVVDLVRTRALTPVYQPIVEVATGRVVGFEGLVRPLAGTGFDNPGSLFVAAESTGRTAELDRLCVETILAGAGDLGADQTLSINLSPHTLEAPEFSVHVLVRVLAAAGFAPDRVFLELTERQAITDVDSIRRHLVACQTAGFRVAIDDVGAGNAGLRLLSQLHFDTVKIDLSLVHAGAKREASLEVLRSISGLAARWGAKAVAEGVETPSQLRMVRDLGLAEVQGYLLGAPAPTAMLRQVELEPLLRDSTLQASLGFATAPASAPASPLG
jgi:diguanylate cyclase (GGDEF)-like protein